jgi:hypothetical protein
VDNDLILRRIIRKELYLNSQSLTEDWYSNAIEEPIRDIVKHLRNDGFNTECSCGHKMYVQCQYVPDGEIFRLHKSILNFLDINHMPKNYEIIAKIKVVDGHSYPFLNIQFPVNAQDG